MSEIVPDYLYERASAAYESEGRHSQGLWEALKVARTVRITDKMISDAQWEMGGASREQAWRVIACALRAGGFEVQE